jgi:hypothetical protein
MADFGRDFWMFESGSGQKNSLIHEKYMMMMTMIIKPKTFNKTSTITRVEYIILLQIGKKYYTYEEKARTSIRVTENIQIT